MGLSEILILTGTILVSLYLSYTDIRWNIAKNVYTVGLLAFGLFWQVVYIFHYEVLTIWASLFILVEAWVISFLIYYIGGWAPGDAKLYLALAVCIPPSLLDTAAPFVLVVNTFVIYFLVIGTFVIYKSTWKDLTKLLDGFTLHKFFRFAYSFSSFIGVAVLLRSLLPFELSYFEVIIFFILLYLFFDRFVKERWQQVILGVFFSLTLYTVINNPELLKMIGIVLILFFILRNVFASLSLRVLSSYVPVTDLRLGMMPAERIVCDKNGQYIKQEKLFFNFVSAFAKDKKVEVVVDTGPMGLSQEDIAKLAELYSQKKLTGLNIQSTISFVPFIIVGFVLTVLCKKVCTLSIIEYLRFVF